MEVIKVTGCTDCPFCQIEWSPDSIGFDTTLSCGLYGFGKTAYMDNIIDVLDSYAEEKKLPKTPKWCPLTEIQITKQ
jgi:hypothetical protein